MVVIWKNVKNLAVCFILFTKYHWLNSKSFLAIKTQILYIDVEDFFVRVKGLEPPSREALDPKSSVSTNFTTPAQLKVNKYNQVLLIFFW